MKIFCVKCQKDVIARLTAGQEIYPRQENLWERHYWKCETCKNYVGCHHKSKNSKLPLGNIPTPELRRARQKIHEILDPLWANRKRKKQERRTKIYNKISDELGYRYHTGEISSLEEARKVYLIIKKLTEGEENGIITEELEHVLS